MTRSDRRAIVTSLVVLRSLCLLGRAGAYDARPAGSSTTEHD